MCCPARPSRTRQPTMAEEEEVLRKRLLAKEGGLRQLTKQYLSFVNSIEGSSNEECQALYNALSRKLAEYEFSVNKASALVDTNTRQIAEYDVMQQNIESEMYAAVLPPLPPPPSAPLPLGDLTLQPSPPRAGSRRVRTSSGSALSCSRNACFVSRRSSTPSSPSESTPSLRASRRRRAPPTPASFPPPLSGSGLTSLRPLRPRLEAAHPPSC